MKRSSLMIVFLVIAQLRCGGDGDSEDIKSKVNSDSFANTYDLEKLINSNSVAKSDTEIKEIYPAGKIPKEEDLIKDLNKNGIEGDQRGQEIKVENPMLKSSNILETAKRIENKEDEGIKIPEKELVKSNNQVQEKSTIKKILSSVIHVVQAIAGIYICLFGFRVFRLLMIILGFFTSYYLILLFLTEYEIFDKNSVGPQLALFIISIILGFVISVLSYMFDKVNFVIFGLSVGCMFGLFYAQFFVDFADIQDRITLFTIVLASSGLVIVAAYFMLDMTVIVGSAFIGSIITPISIGILLDYFESFEERTRKEGDFVRQLYAFLVASGLMFLTGIPAQIQLRTRILTKFEDESLEETKSQTLVN